ncbi:immunoglobulin superfamily member 11 isoform X4 [Corythoichthys intestinalis]|uniref:immunoglobulin superfamily member 11 isoform X4 n=1 Tax=Corythoichthys intestinalis TaxID=161448 RepID=UPI0025A61E65|nr:immunoglobulin superfamily member 11 isoform X4 [Corythoichthys intestinalis]
MPSFLFWHMRGEERRACASYRFPSAMAAPGWCALWTLCVCFTALQTNALRVTMRESTMEVVRGDYVILPCSFFTSSPLSRLNIIWTLAPFSSPESPIQVIVYDHGQIIEDPSLIGRVGFTGLPWSADIMVNDTRVSDAGVYRCMVNNPPEAADPGIGELLLTVLVAPSLPACRWDGDMDTGGSVTLSCSVAEGIPTPEIRWDKLNPEEISLPINMEDKLPPIQSEKFGSNLAIICQASCRVQSKSSTCLRRRPACIDAPPPTCSEQRTATSTCPSIAQVKRVPQGSSRGCC